MATQQLSLPDTNEAKRQVWELAQSLSCVLTVDVPVPKFTIGDLLRLEKGNVISTRCAHGNDVPLRVNGVLISWAEFEVLGDRLAVRLTELE